MGISFSLFLLFCALGRGELKFFSGGSKHETFVTLFDLEGLLEKFIELGHDHVVIYGEAYGGKINGMSETYGKDMKFIAFEVKVGDYWLAVPDAEDVTLKLGLEFVHYDKIDTNLLLLYPEKISDQDVKAYKKRLEKVMRGKKMIRIKDILNASKSA